MVTGGGLSCGLDVGLHLVHRLAGPDLARATARQVDHPWQPLATERDTPVVPPRSNGQAATRS